MTGSQWFDTHCHFQLAEDAEAVYQRAREEGVERMVCVGTDVASSRAVLQFAGEHPAHVWAAVGVHPHDAIQGTDDLIDLVNDAERNNDTTLVAIGECGLDYYYEHSPRMQQREVFANQIALAKEKNLTLVIHTRDAWDDTFAILRSEGAPPRTVIHCFSGGPAEARKALEQDFYLSFSGIVTFKKADDIREAAVLCPIERLVIETDSPFLAPVPYRGKVNEPRYVSNIGKFLAVQKNAQVDQFAARIYANATELFGLR